MPRPVLILALAIAVLIGAALVFGNHPGTSTVSTDTPVSTDTGTRVDAPGTRVETSDEGTRVQAPGVDITVPKKPDGE
ncbi:hypothetical protein [Hyphomicrobium sp.]|uniref:hypothetical protein n=1 Tax=Hyphomicrobium sp. TaxID=82 RepID=UPI003F7235AE